MSGFGFSNLVGVKPSGLLQVPGCHANPGLAERPLPRTFVGPPAYFEVQGAVLITPIVIVLLSPLNM